VLLAITLPILSGEDRPAGDRRVGGIVALIAPR
jgi:hypothetical protein